VVLEGAGKFEGTKDIKKPPKFLSAALRRLPRRLHCIIHFYLRNGLFFWCFIVPFVPYGFASFELFQIVDLAMSFE
jgi:hypothetical protein